MTDLNSVTLIGRLTRDAEQKYLPSGASLVTFAIAVNRSWKKDGEVQDQVSFIDCKLWGKLGEALQQYLVKGKQIAVSGSLEQERWEQDGQKRQRLTVRCSDMQLLGDKGSSGGQRQQSNAGGSQTNTQDGFEDDIPF